MKRLPLLSTVMVAAAIFLARTARAETSGPQLIPRLTLIELDYPQIVAASVGFWMTGTGSGPEPGLLVDVQAGLSGPKVALGLGAVSSGATSYEKAYSGGIQAVALRTWSGWS